MSFPRFPSWFRSEYWQSAVLFALPVLLISLVVMAFTERPVSNTVTLPVEVIGADSHTESVTVHASEGSDADSLYLKAHSVGYPYWEEFGVAKASVRFNGGPWTDLTDAIASCRYPESAFDCIDGPYPTVRLEVAADDVGGNLNDGTNTIDFRFNYAFSEDSPDNFGAISSGYRVLGVELRRSNDSDVIDGTTFSWDDPSSWTAPEGFGNAADVSDGKALWNERNSLTTQWGSDDQIIASCGDCHASNGRDLAYFAYSNKSIVARSKFHGLTESQGKKIAAYIRSYQLEDPDTGHSYSPPGRPWHPVYQPGPTSIASRSEKDPRTMGTRISEMPGEGSQYAAAGAGLQWALDRDEEMLPHVFPGGPSSDDFDIDSARDGMHVPAPIQFPDWNGWLPAHHPLDMWGPEVKNWSDWRSGFWDPAEGTAGGEHASLSDYEQCASSSGAGSKQCLEDLWWATRFLGTEAHNFAEEEDQFVKPKYSDITTQSDEAYRIATLKKWATVRLWEVIESSDAADELDALDSHNGGTWSNTDWYTWPGGHLPFGIPPHINGHFAGDKDRAYDLWLDNTWYEVTVRMNSGRGHKLGNRPVDWQYQNTHLDDLMVLGIRQPLRRVFTFMKSFEVCESFSSDLLHLDSNPRAWSTNRYICGAALGVSHDFFTHLDTYQPGLHRQTFETLLEEQVETMMYRHSPNLGEDVDANWERVQDDRAGWEPESAVVDTNAAINAGFWKDSGEEHSQFYHMLKYANDLGVRQTLIDSAAAWNDAMVPSPAWSSAALPVEMSFFTATRTESSALLRWRTEGEVHNAGFDVLHCPPHEERCSQVAFIEGAGTTSEAQTYRFHTGPLEPGTHRFRLRQIDLDGSSSRTAPQVVKIGPNRALSLSLVGPNPTGSTTQLRFSLKETGLATVSLFDVAGRRVSELYRQKLRPGTTETLNVSLHDAPSGAYFVRLSGPNGSRVQKVVVTK